MDHLLHFYYTNITGEVKSLWTKTLGFVYVF